MDSEIRKLTDEFLLDADEVDADQLEHLIDVYIKSMNEDFDLLMTIKKLKGSVAVASVCNMYDLTDKPQFGFDLLGKSFVCITYLEDEHIGFHKVKVQYRPSHIVNCLIEDYDTGKTLDNSVKLTVEFFKEFLQWSKDFHSRIK